MVKVNSKVAAKNWIDRVTKLAEAFIGNYKAHFKQGAKFTLIIRMPDTDNADLIISDDNLEMVKGAIENLKKHGDEDKKLIL